MNCSRFFRAAFPMVLALALCACKPAQTEKSSKDGKTLAEVNGHVITTDDLRQEADRLPPYLRPMVQSAEGKKELLDSMIFREIILEKAKKEGLDKSKEVTDRLEDLRKRLIAETYLKQKVEQEAKVSDAEMKNFYEQNRERFKSGEQVRASHILVKTEKEAQDILEQIKKGAGFEEMAKKYSKDSTAAKGGDLGWFPRKAMVPEFEKAAFSLKEGELSGIVKTSFGYHIIKVTGRRPAGERSFDEAKDQIKANLLPAKQQEVVQRLREDLQKNAKVSINQDLLKEVNLDTPEGKEGATAPK